MRAGFVLLLCAASAACEKPAEQRSVAENEAAQVEAVESLSGWERVFAAPVETVGSINQAGFALPAYGPAGPSGVYGAQGIERLMSRSSAPSPNMGAASVAGSAPDRLDQVSYVLKINDAGDAAAARDRLAQAVGEFMARAKIAGGEPVLVAIRAGEVARPTVDGLPVSVTATPARIDVTFLRPAANRRAANS